MEKKMENEMETREYVGITLGLLSQQKEILIVVYYDVLANFDMGLGWVWFHIGAGHGLPSMGW